MHVRAIPALAAGVSLCSTKVTKRSKRRRTIHHQQSHGTHRYNTGFENAQRAVHRHRIQRQCVFCRAFPQGLDKRLDYERLAHVKQRRSENVDLWKELLSLMQIHEVSYVKVKGHADNELNNRCDALARGAIKELQKTLPAQLPPIPDGI